MYNFLIPTQTLQSSTIMHYINMCSYTRQSLVYKEKLDKTSSVHALGGSYYF